MVPEGFAKTNTGQLNLGGAACSSRGGMRVHDIDFSMLCYTFGYAASEADDVDCRHPSTLSVASLVWAFICLQSGHPGAARSRPDIARLRRRRSACHHAKIRSRVRVPIEERERLPPTGGSSVWSGSIVMRCACPFNRSRWCTVTVVTRVRLIRYSGRDDIACSNYDRGGCDAKAASVTGLRSPASLCRGSSASLAASSASSSLGLADDPLSRSVNGTCMFL